MSELFSGTGEGLARLGLEILGKGSNVISSEFRQRWFNASGKYITNYKKRHCQLKVLGMREPVDLAKVYTGVKLLNDDDISEFESTEALEDLYRQTRFRGYTGIYSDMLKRSGISVANEKQYLMVLGGPGAGTSTFLRKIGLEALKALHHEDSTYKHQCVPVLLELKRLESDEIDIPALIAKEFSTCGFPEPQQFAINALEQGKLLIILDGLDEVPTANLKNAIHSIQDFVDYYDENRFLASCRTAAYRGSFKRFSDVSMADFDDQQIEQFICNWFSSEQDIERETSNKCWEVLQQAENKSAKELAHTPLLLTFLCLVYDRAQRFPNNRSTLYKKALRILLEEWAAEKRINRDEIYDGLSIELEEELLAEIAYTGFVSDQLFFSQRELTQQIKGFLSSNLNAPRTLDGKEVLRAIEVQQGILVERAEDAYSFSHLTLQEYLTAQYLINNQQWDEIIKKYAVEVRWREVLLLASGLFTGKQGANPLLTLLDQQSLQYLTSPKVRRWIQKVTYSTIRSQGKFKDCAKRSSAIFLALSLAKSHQSDQLQMQEKFEVRRAIENIYEKEMEHVLANAEELAKHLAPELFSALNPELVRLRARAFAERLFLLKIFKRENLGSLFQALKNLQKDIPSRNASKVEIYAFRKKLSEAWFSVLELTEYEVRLSPTQYVVLANYLYICELMVRCKEAAIRVSPEVWEDIESHILNIPVE
ncbi:MAG: NACHT domain-containing protein [Cyanobacteria bacterium P01_D01_bin.156]